LDNICHTLVGAALARTGLDKRTPLAAATMMIGANFPDIDVVTVPFGADIGYRRGITHGVPAHIVLPFVLAGLMLAWDRWVRRRRDPTLAPAVPRQILLLAAISIATHPFLDWCNSYGMRWLMPMKNEWFYGDILFIVEPWLWFILLAGYVGRRYSRRVPTVAVVVAAGYIAMMAAVTNEGRRFIEARTGKAGHYTRRQLMVAPVALKPFDRDVVLATDSTYLIGHWNWRGPFTWSAEIRINRDDPAARLAQGDPSLQPFLHWARFPFYIVHRTAAGRTNVEVADARYADQYGGGWASRTVGVPAK
jgi:inner membrane protein